MRMKRVLALVLSCMLILACVAVAAPTASAGTIPMTWKQFDKAYVVFEIDVSDNASDNQTIRDFYSILTQKYGFPLCVSTTTESMSPQKVSNLHMVEDHGGEITSHTHSGRVLNSTVKWDDVDFEFKTSLDIFKQYGFNVNGIMLMGGGGSQEPDPNKREDTSETYRAQIEQYVSKYYEYSDLYGISAQYYNPRVPITIGGNQIKERIDEAIENKSWISIYTHGLTDDNYPEGYLTNILDYLKEKEEAGQLEVVTYKYIYENLANWQGNVDFGDTKYTVDFYSTDNKTLLASKVVVKGGDAEAPLLDIASGVTFTGWSAPITNVTDNLSVYADCSYADGTKVSPNEASPLKPHTTHSYGDFVTDEAGHEGTCSVCGEKQEKENHDFNGQVCSVCGYTAKVTETTPTVPSSSTTSTTSSVPTQTTPTQTAPTTLPPQTTPTAPSKTNPTVPSTSVTAPIKTTPVPSASTAPIASATDVEPTVPTEPIVTQPSESQPSDLQPEPGKDGGGSVLLYVLIGVAVLVLIAGGVVLYLFLQKKKAIEQAENTEQADNNEPIDPAE